MPDTYTVACDAISARWTKSPAWICKNALRELNQKRIMNDAVVRRIKRRCAVRRGVWQCPRCQMDASRLTAAHVGRPVSAIIDEVLRDNRDVTDVVALDRAVQAAHVGKEVVVCCDACNKLLEN